MSNFSSGVGPQDGQPSPMMEYNPETAFYAFNLVANWAYSRWNWIYPDVLKEIKRRETIYQELSLQMDEEAAGAYESDGAEKAVEMVTSFTKALGETLVKDWNRSVIRYILSCHSLCARLAPEAWCSPLLNLCKKIEYIAYFSSTSTLSYVQRTICHSKTLSKMFDVMNICWHL